jgi:hypothetical protein
LAGAKDEIWPQETKNEVATVAIKARGGSVETKATQTCGSHIYQENGTKHRMNLIEKRSKRSCRRVNKESNGESNPDRRRSYRSKNKAHQKSLAAASERD